MTPTFRFLRQLLAPRPEGVVRAETTYRLGKDALPASLYHPSGADAGPPLPGWTALHGLSASGRDHPSLDRFARALAASGAVVLVPELPQWRDLHIAPGTTVPTIRAAVLELDRSPLTEPGRIGAIGFSFGATQALVAASDPALHGHLAGVAAWGGYADLERCARFLFVGDHELDGRRYHRDPDPYGRWILAGNYLSLLPEHEDDRVLGEALLGLAREAGRLGVMSWSPETDPLKEAARERLDPGQRAAFDLIAPPATRVHTPAERVRLEKLSERLTRAAVAKEPLLDPSGYLPRVPVPVFLAHGREDRLMPWTELERLRRSLPPDRIQFSAITGLFSHSFGQRRVPTPATVLEALRFLRMISRMLRLI